MTEWIPIAALGLSVLTFVSSQITTRRAASLTYVDSVAKRVTQLGHDLEMCLKECERSNQERDRLFRENVELMRQILPGSRP